PESEIARLKSGSVIIPYEYVDNHFVIPVKIDGQNRKLAIDTGCGTTVIAMKALQGTSFTPTPTEAVAITGAESKKFGTAILSSLGLADIALDNVFVDTDEASQFWRFYDGLLGTDLLQRFLVTVDSGSKTIVLADRNITK